MSELRRDLNTNIVFLMRDEEILLAMKLRGLGKDKWNGVGGKIKPGESLEAAAVRETKEEIEVTITMDALRHVADLRFYGGPAGYMGSRVYQVDQWQGEPKETDEMRPQWFLKSDIPYDEMWDGDRIWLKEVLDGRHIEAEFYFDLDNNVDHYEIRDLSEKA